MSNLDGAAISQIQNMAVAALSLDAVEKSLCPAVVLRVISMLKHGALTGRSLPLPWCDGHNQYR